jgi:predicted secreted protein
MIRLPAPAVAAIAASALFAAGATHAQQPAPASAASPPSVAVTGAASTKVQNDQMLAMVRAESEQATAAAAAADVNARMARALAAAKATPGVEAKSAGYSTWQQWEKGKPGKWRVTQSLSLTGADFPALAALVSKLQDDGGLMVSSISFTLAPQTRRRAEDALTKEAIRAWQQRAATAAEALGFEAWRPGRLNVATGDFAPQPRYDMAMRASAAPAPAPPVAVEGGATELTVTVTGDAVLDKPATR